MENQTQSTRVKTIRPGSLDDLELLLAHRMNMFRDMGHTDEDLLTRVTQNNRVYLERTLAAGEYLAWIVEIDGQPAGSGAVILLQYPPSMKNATGQLGYILSIYTEPAWRHQGVATWIMQTILDDLREKGIPVASLHASDAGRPLYEQLGFKQTNEFRLNL